MTGLLFAKGVFVQMKKRESTSSSHLEYPFSRDDVFTMEIDPVVKDYDFTAWFDGANEYVKQNAEKYCGCLGLSASKLILLIDNNYIDFAVADYFREVVIYRDENFNRCTATIDVGQCRREFLYNPWEKFKYMYLAYGGDPEKLRKFDLMEIVPYSKFKGKGVSIGGRSVLDEMMDKAVQRGLNVIGIL